MFLCLKLGNIFNGEADCWNANIINSLATKIEFLLVLRICGGMNIILDVSKRFPVLGIDMQLQ